MQASDKALLALVPDEPVVVPAGRDVRASSPGGSGSDTCARFAFLLHPAPSRSLLILPKADRRAPVPSLAMMPPAKQKARNFPLWLRPWPGVSP